ncbi:MAG: hypothetical protein SF182_22845 [Deltaproteobacteria bacterium]|nr:hypothetical protein [Deltaproteobacteria bacterium]
MDVHAELHVLRRRLNGLRAQQSVALALTGITLCAALLMAVALRAAPIWFAIASWGGVLLLLGLLAYLPWRAYRAWLSLDDTAHLADRQSGLDGRLSTLLADPVPTSRLRPILIEQVRLARPRWQAETLAPRRVAPALLLIPASLTVFSIAAFLVRPAARATHALQPWQSRPPTLGGGADRESRIALASADTDGGDGSSEKALTTATAQHGKGGAQGDGDRDGGRLDQQGDAAGDAAGAAHDASGSDRLREAIRQAMGADSEGAAPHDARGKRQGGTGGDSAAAQNQQDQPPGSGSNPDAPGTHTADAKPNTAASQPHPDELAKVADARSGDGGTKGAGLGGAAGNLFTEAPRAAAAGGAEAKPMPIKLGAFAAAAPQRAEPQRRNGPVSQVAMTSAGRAAAPDLALAQAPDAALQKLDLAPEHESIVRRIFTRE